MTPQRVKTGVRAGWRYRYTNPITGRRSSKTIWQRERREADNGFREFLENLEAKAIGLPTKDAWKMPYQDLVAKFLAEAPIASEKQRAALRRILEGNELKLQVTADLGNVGKLNARCLKLRTEGQRSDYHVTLRLQKFLKQLSRWAASIGLLPYDPLQAWKRLPFAGHKKQRRAYKPAEMEAILKAAAKFDAEFGRAFPSGIVIRTLLLTGSRPGPIFDANVAHLDRGRIVLPPGRGAKRNGMATLPAEFVKELKAYVAARDGAKSDDPLLLSHSGCRLDRVNFSKDFNRVLALAAVETHWPAWHADAADTDPVAVAHLIYSGRTRGFDGPAPKDPEKLAKRERKVQATQAVAVEIQGEVAAWLKDRDLYTLRKTHISWARRLVNPDSVKLQVGHAPRDVEERHYLDLVDAREASQAVWDVLSGRRTLAGEQVRKVLHVAVAGSSEPVAVGQNPEPMVHGVVHGAATGAKADRPARVGSAVTDSNIRGYKWSGRPAMDIS